MLQRRGIKVGIVYPLMLRFSARWNRDEDIVEPADYVDDDLPTYYSFVRGPLPWARNLNAALLRRLAFRKLRLYMEEYGRPDLIHSHALLHGGIAADHAAERLGVPFVHTEHLTSLIYGYGPADKYKTSWARRVYRAAAQCLVVSSGFGDDLAGGLGVDREVFSAVPNIVSERFLDAAIPRAKSRPFVFFTNCFLSPRKNIELLLDAFALVSRQYPDTVLKIGGYAPTGYGESAGGSITDRLAERAQSLGLGDSVSFLGRLSRDEVVEQVRESHAFALTSSYESFGVVLIEALAVGRPIVSTKSVGPRDIVEEENGLLVEQHEPEPFAAAMVALMENYDRYDQRRLAERCRERFCEETIGDRILQVYEAALRGPS